MQQKFLFALAVALFASRTMSGAEKVADSLIGKPAPEIPGTDSALNGTPTDLAKLKGKVVLLDFWAVWCGPCRATFPHLRAWNSRFHDQGLEVVGITGYYKALAFDKATGKMARAAKELSKSEEQAMLRDFAAYYRLNYRIVALGQVAHAKMVDQYGVRGIPHVVLVDRQGKVRMVKVGAGKENADALETKIKELLAEKAPAESSVASLRDQGTNLLRQGDYRAAIDFMNRAIAQDPKDYLAYNERAAAYTYLDKDSEAIQDFTRAIGLNDRSAKSLRGRGAAYFRQGKHAEALTDFNRAIQLDPTYVLAYQGRSAVYRKLGKSKEAAADEQTIARLRKG